MKPEDPPPEQSIGPAPDDTAAHPAEANLWEQVFSRENLAKALRRVEQNAGAAGIAQMGTEELRPWLKDHWPLLSAQLDAGTYRPQPVRRVMIGKPSGLDRELTALRVGVDHGAERAVLNALLAGHEHRTVKITSSAPARPYARSGHQRACGGVGRESRAAGEHHHSRERAHSGARE